MSEANLMLALNEALQKKGEELGTWFYWVRYALIGAISALLTKKANPNLMILWLSNWLIWVAKTIDLTVMGLKILEN